MVNGVGAVSREFVVDKAMLAPPSGAALDRVTVQVLDAFGPKVDGVQTREETSACALRVRVALAELPLYVAVMIGLRSGPIPVVVALKVAAMAAAATVTEAGTVSADAVAVNVTTAPPAGAALDRVTVQVLDAFGPKVDGVQTREETRACALGSAVARE